MAVTWKDDAAVQLLLRSVKTIVPRIARASLYFLIAYLLATSQLHLRTVPPFYLGSVIFLMALGSRTVWAADGVIIILAALAVVPKNWLG
jgi:hypothetical protein